MNIKNKSVFVFDWDGTLFDSMAIKRNNFVEAFLFVFLGIGNRGASVRKNYIELSGKPREELFEDIARQMGCQIDDEKYSAFNKKFSELNIKHLMTALMFEDAIGFLNDLMVRGVHVYISSSAPEPELLDIVDSVFPDKYKQSIAGIFGTTEYHCKGLLHIKRICEETKIDRRKIIFFGDDYEDEIRSHEAKVDCIIIDREERLKGKVKQSVKSFYEVQEYLDD